jgi:hypothetical protein
MDAGALLSFGVVFVFLPVEHTQWPNLAVLFSHILAPATVVQVNAKPVTFSSTSG